ncbi:hypothetical protein LWI29_009212 [Acer saccharum]|uniref:HTH myb-type domain-containing protein n=1 Tax=Acer saccharum TaxID=4024 RepID=A0AA39S7J0_ACESA|nr:hypothetical protein LWI29_009212 [Acer saccharum]
MSFSERSNKGKGKLSVDGDQNNLPGSHNGHTISQQQNFGGGGGDLTVVQERQGAALTLPTPLPHAASTNERTERRPQLTNFTDRIDPLRWTPELHNHFVRAVDVLGGPDRATAKAITEKMAIGGLKESQVKSHLQTYRNWIRDGKIQDTSKLPRESGSNSNKAGKIDGPNTASTSASTSSREHERNGPGMGDHNVGGNLETGTVTAQQPGHQQPYQVIVANISVSNGYSIPGLSTAINNVQGGQQEQLYGVTNGIARANGYSIPGPCNNSAHWVQPAQVVGVGSQEPTSNAYSIPGPYNNSTISTAINNVQGGQQEQLCGVTNAIAQDNMETTEDPIELTSH